MNSQYLNSRLSEHLNMEEILDIEHSIEESNEKKEKPIQKKDEPKQLFLQNYDGTPLEIKEINDESNKSDLELARASIRNVLVAGNENLGALLQLARATEHPRAFEVAATFAKTIVDAATKLEELVTEKKKGTSDGKSSGPQITNQTNIYTTSETAMKAFRERKAMKQAIENQS